MNVPEFQLFALIGTCSTMWLWQAVAAHPCGVASHTCAIGGAWVGLKKQKPGNFLAIMVCTAVIRPSLCPTEFPALHWSTRTFIDFHFLAQFGKTASLVCEVLCLIFIAEIRPNPLLHSASKELSASTFTVYCIATGMCGGLHDPPSALEGTELMAVC